MIQYGSYDGYLKQTIKFYQNMQYQVEPVGQTQENGQKPHFLLFFAQFMHIVHTLLIMHDL